MAGIDQLIGSDFGFLTVIGEAPRKESLPYQRVVWVKCVCGVTKAVSVGHLKSGHTKSCGCKQHRSLPLGEAFMNRCYDEYLSSSKKRNLVFDIDISQFRRIITSDCIYCLAKPKTIKKKKTNGSVPITGLDRLDNGVGYVLTNVVPCCFTCNRAKGNMTLVDWLAYVSNFARVSESEVLSRIGRFVQSL